MSVLPVLLVVTAFAGFAWLTFVAAGRRRKQLAALADSRGWRFLPGSDAGFELAFPEFACFRKGDNRYAFNRLEGRFGQRDFLAVDYHYETHSTDSKGNRQTHHHHFSAAIVATDLPLKPLRLRPENFLDRFAEFFGLDDIDFESSEFSRRFHVTAEDRRWAYDVIDQAMMEFLLGQPEFQVELAPRRLLARLDRTFRGDDYPAALGLLDGLLDHLPRSLLRELRDSEAAAPLPAPDSRA